MGYTIIDARSFIKTTRGIIPLALGGSNNCSEFIYDRNFKPREVRERHWFLLGGINLLELPEGEFVAKVNTTFPDTDDECWKMNSKWVTCSQARKWFARAAKDAATLEDILAANPGVNDLNVGLMPYTSGDHLLWRYVRTTDELEVWLDEARELVKEHKDHYIFMSFSGTQRGERLRPARARDVKGPLVVQKRNAGYVRAFDNVNGRITVHFTKDVRDAIHYPSAEAATAAMGEVISVMGLEFKTVTRKMTAPRPYVVMCTEKAYAGKYVKKSVKNNLQYTSSVDDAQRFISEKDAEAKISSLRGKFLSAQYLKPVYVEA